MFSLATRRGEAQCTAESVTRGHPDRLCDQVADLVVDAVLERDPEARVSCQAQALAGRLEVSAGIATLDAGLCGDLHAALPGRIRGLLRDIGYRSAALDLSPRNCAIELQLQPAPVRPEAGAETVVFGYACDETPELLPLPWALASALTRRLAGQVGVLGSPLRPEGRAQVTVVYRDGRPQALQALTVDCQHWPDAALEEVRSYLQHEVVTQAVPAHWRLSCPELRLNAGGRWTVGGPQRRRGASGSQRGSDTYGGACPHGGRALPGTGPGEVERAGAYRARELARHVVAAGLATHCTVQIAYAAGRAEPLALRVDDHGSGQIEHRRLARALNELFDLTPAGIVESLGLRRPRYLTTAIDGQFVAAAATPPPWEQLTQIDALRRAVARPSGAGLFPLPDAVGEDAHHVQGKVGRFLHQERESPLVDGHQPTIGPRDGRGAAPVIADERHLAEQAAGAHYIQ
jgi:S-adenosylmethionine synthetase